MRLGMFYKILEYAKSKFEARRLQICNRACRENGYRGFVNCVCSKADKFDTWFYSLREIIAMRTRDLQESCS